MQNALQADIVTQEWNYYNYCMVPNVFPHEIVDDTKVKTGKIWKGPAGPATLTAVKPLPGGFSSSGMPLI